MAADIRPARASDVDALVAIENAAFRTDRLSQRSLRRLIASPSAAVMVISAGGIVAGYCVILFRANSAAARLYSIATAAGFSGRGLGRRLLAAAEKEALAHTRRTLRLEVREDNRRAIAIYRRAGFEPTGLKTDYYQDGTTAIRLEKCLTGTGFVNDGRNSNNVVATGGPFSRSAEKTPRRATP